MLNIYVGAVIFMTAALLWTVLKAPSNIRLAQSKILPGGYRQAFLEERGMVVALVYILLSGLTMMLFSGVVGAFLGGFVVARLRDQVTYISPEMYIARKHTLASMRSVDGMSGNIFILSGSMQGELVYRYRFASEGGLRDGWVSPETSDVLLMPEDRQDGVLEVWRCKSPALPESTLSTIYWEGKCPLGPKNYNQKIRQRYIFRVPKDSIDTSIQIR